MKPNACEEKIKKDLDPVLLEVAEKFKARGHGIYLVGGFIRDLLLNRKIPNNEFDLATSATPDEMKGLFRRVIPTGIKHGTITLLFNDRVFEITTFRSDGKYSDGRHPDEIRFARTIEEDLSRRDFTINAMAFDLLRMRLIDLYGGREDLTNRVIRTIGRPDTRFQEDGLRLMRAVRFSALLEFRIEDGTFRSISRNLFMLEKVAMERIRDEFVKIMQSRKPSLGLELLRRTEILRKIIPELLTGYGLEQNKFHKYDVYHHLLHSCDAAPAENLCLRLAALFHDICKPATRTVRESREDPTFYNHEILSSLVAKKIMKRLKFSNEITEKVEKLVLLHMFYYTEEWTDSAVRRFLKKAGLDLVEDLFTLREADRIGNGTKEEKSRHLEELKRRIKKVLEEENAFSLKHLKVNGTDVMRIRNIPPSPLIGRILDYLLEKVLDDSSLNTKENLEKMIREYAE